MLKTVTMTTEEIESSLKFSLFEARASASIPGAVESAVSREKEIATLVVICCAEPDKETQCGAVAEAISVAYLMGYKDGRGSV